MKPPPEALDSVEVVSYTYIMARVLHSMASCALHLALCALTCILAPSCSAPAPVANGRRVEVNIRRGMSIPVIADSLAAKGVIQNRLAFGFYAWYYNYAPRIRPGRYRLQTGTGERRALRLLSGEEPALVMVTIPEGFTLKQIAATLEEQGVCSASDFLEADTDRNLRRKFAILAGTNEGYLFPETYEFLTGSSAVEVAERMLRQFRTVMNELGRSPAKMTDHEYVTLASVVEREAKIPAEYPRIAGVFANRLRRRIPLQSCATVEYILPARKEKLTNGDLKTESPYNTYLHTGLPPGPICNPGRLALEAALYPERHGYIFFVSRGDGTHIFSRTAAEHTAACARVRSGS